MSFTKKGLLEVQAYISNNTNEKGNKLKHNF